MANLQFDHSEWTVTADSLHPRPTTFSAGRGISGFEQIRSINNGYWRGTVQIAFKKNSRRLPDFRGFLTALKGRENTMTLTLCDRLPDYAAMTYEQQLAEIGLNINELCGPVGGKYGLPFSDGQCFADGTGFEIPEFSADNFKVTANAIAGAETLKTGPLDPYVIRGMRFSVNEYLHEVTSVQADGVTFFPPLRQAVVAGSVLKFDKPQIRVRLSSDASGVSANRHGPQIVRTSIEVEEVMGR